MKSANYTYDKNMDLLYMYKSFETARGSIDVFPNIILDIGENKKIIGIEIFEASKVLHTTKIKLEKNIKNVNFSTIMQPSFYGFVIDIVLANDGKIRHSMGAPLITPISVSR